LNSLEIRCHAVKFSSNQQINRLLALEDRVGMVQVGPNGVIVREGLFKQGDDFEKSVKLSGPPRTCSLKPTMRGSSGDVQDSAEDLLRHSQQSNYLREARRPMASGFECAQAVQLFEQGCRLHFGIKKHEDGSGPRLAKHFDRVFSIKVGYANVHQNDVRPLLFHLLKVL